MRLYTFPKWLRWLYPGAIWDFSYKKEKTIYLTFDDGPNPEITDLILNLLQKYNAPSTFFCLGTQVKSHPDIYQRILDAGHSVGNHSMTHPNGWWSRNKTYYKDVYKAEELIDSKLFRPPYGRVGWNQYRALKKHGFQTIFWTVVSYDFDPEFRAEKFVKKMKKLSKPGAIFVFHDNPKAQKILETELEQLLKFWANEGYRFKSIPYPTS